MKSIRHIITILTSLLLLLGVPFYIVFFSNADNGLDAISGASMVIDQPSGAYVVWINSGKHTNIDNLNTWKSFFSGEEIGFLFEDISCTVAGTDTAGLEIAKSFQSRLPENQMTLRTEDVTLMLSKAVDGRFDIILMSKEFYDGCHAGNLYDKEYMTGIFSEGK